MKIKTKRGARRIRNQRVIDRRFVVTDYKGCSYITPGKLYRLYDGHQIIDNHGCIIPAPIMFASAHFRNIGTWYHPIR